MLESKRSQLVAAAVIVLVLIATFVFRGQRAPVRNLDSRGSEIVAFGDSLTAGYGASAGEDYPAKLSTMIGRTIINAGVSGDTTDSALGRIDDAVLARNPRIVIVGLGGNDYLRGAPIDSTENNLRTIVKKIQDRGAMVVLLGFRFPSLNANYEAMYARVSRDEQALLVPDMLDGILSDEKLRSDAVHPNAAGYAIMAERVAGPLRKLIARADRAH